jgi:hypothetical protein
MTTPKMNELTYIYVTWRDAHSATTTWTAARDLDQDPYIVRTGGFLLSLADGGKEGHITIFQSITPDGDVDHVLCIPKEMVVDFKCVQINLPDEVAPPLQT